MDAYKARDLANAEMKKQGLIQAGWRFAFNRRKKGLGLCMYSSRMIFLSSIFVAHNKEDIVLNTIRHEVAHALTPGANHGRIWKVMARKIGCVSVQATNSVANMPRGRWTTVCKICGSTCEHHRRTRVIKMNARGYHCAKCGRRSLNQLVVTQNF